MERNDETAENDALAKALAFPGHSDHFAAWFGGGRKVRHEDVGGIQCLCGWSAPADSQGFRPWRAWYAHLADVLIAAGWRVFPPGKQES